MISPVSPISIFDTEAVATHMIRADFGAFICFTICAAQASDIIHALSALFIMALQG